MGRYRRTGIVAVRHGVLDTGLSGRHQRRRHSLPIFAFVAAMAFVFVSVIAPDDAMLASASTPAYSDVELQSLSLSAGYATEVTRDGYTVTKKVIVVPKPARVRATGDAGAAQAIAYEMVKARGWGDEQFACLVDLFNRESHWNVYAANPSGAYGIPQALPGSKMASAGADWQTNPATQITWGLGYIAGRYGTPCGAWQASETKGWY